MPHSYDYDAIVIGSGPGGEGAAMGLVKQGARVAVIERYQNVAAVAPTGAPSRRKLSVTPSAAL
ncbi:soluble pyridine nucleotide transhydrogenase [Escherichia coli]|uniref:Soluble pyridine nucleotide transhydrogenase n=1 Tax=Escherichia coli TaxID=562 RepID=A0A2X1N4R0_ECOLX|nr:soluble pyridine nucleotide transhydrogenase [Escherichia coli]